MTCHQSTPPATPRSNGQFHAGHPCSLIFSPCLSCPLSLSLLSPSLFLFTPATHLSLSRWTTKLRRRAALSVLRVGLAAAAAAKWQQHAGHQAFSSSEVVVQARRRPKLPRACSVKEQQPTQGSSKWQQMHMHTTAGQQPPHTAAYAAAACTCIEKRRRHQPRRPSAMRVASGTTMRGGEAHLEHTRHLTEQHHTYSMASGGGGGGHEAQWRRRRAGAAAGWPRLALLAAMVTPWVAGADDVDD